MNALSAYLSLVGFAIFMMVLYRFAPQIDRLIGYLEGNNEREEGAG